jgi:hypothetical protein
VPVTEAMTAFDPKLKYTTDRYQVVQSNDSTSGIPQGVTFLNPKYTMSKPPSKMPAQRWSISQGI